MAKSIEFQIRFKAVIIYVTVALGVIAMTVYLNNLRKNISSQRLEIENQHILLSATNDLMFAVNEAQSSASLYLSTKNRKHFNNYTQFVDSVENLIGVIIKFKPAEQEKLHRIENLLREQAQNIRKLNIQFAEPNPVEVLNERLQEYEPHLKEDSLFTSDIQIDTIITKLPRKKSSKRTMVEIVVNQQTNTVKTVEIDSSAIVYEVGDIAQKAQEIYDQNIKTIEKRVGKLMSSDKDIASEISALLLELHKETLDATLSIIGNSEKLIEQNYVYSTAGGVLALGFILIFIILIITDINKGRKARRELEIANERTRQIMESRHKLLLSVSHDIKSPLNSILGYLELMENNPNVRSMQNSSEHILAMMENLLEFSNLEQGTLQKSLSDFNLKDLFEDIYNMFLPLTNQKKLDFSFTANDVKIRTDRIKLKQIVINLVSNAVKYTPNGAVNFEAVFHKNRLKIKVKDTGAGIPDEKLPQLFLPFSRVEENNALAEGTGLGMFVVKGLADLLSGQITVHSKVGKGTTITIAMPAENSLKEIPKGVKKIKVYDDDSVAVKMVSDMLLRLGHKVVGADFDLILTDMEMGMISGLDILQQHSGLPVVVMTGRADFSTQKAIELGFDGFLSKPFTLESLREIVGDGETLDDFLGDNRDEIMALFRVSVEENFAILKQSLADNNFKQAQFVCHKLFPTFAQMGYPTDELRKMDAHRNNEYNGWKSDVEKILECMALCMKG